MIELDFQLLKDLYCIFSPSGNEKKMRRFIKRHISQNIPSAVVHQDVVGNLYVTKGISDTYPCLCAHMDQVQRVHPKDFTCIESSDVIFGYSHKLRHQCGLGADDKNGIFLALTCLAQYDTLKCAFFVGEEIGCVGSSQADTEFFSDCRFCIQIDRRGNSDMVTHISFAPICSDDFISDADPQSWGYAVSSGLMTDVEALRQAGITASCINLSCGYYEPHTDQEFTAKGDLRKCHAFVCHILDTCTRSYPFIVSGYEDYYSSGTYGSGWEYNEFLDVCTDMLSHNPDLDKEFFTDLAQNYYPSLSSADVASAYNAAKSYVA